MSEFVFLFSKAVVYYLMLFVIVRFLSDVQGSIPTPACLPLLTVFLAATLDLALAGKDLLVQAKTGTGKVH